MKYTNLNHAKSVYRDLISLAESKGSADRDALFAYLGKHDVYFLLRYILNRRDVEHPWIFDRCQEVQNAPDGYLDLWARGHYKSSIGCAMMIQDILNNPEITIGIFSHTRPIAKSFLVQIKREFEDNLLLKSLYSDVLWENPKRQAPKWNDDEGIIVKRKTNPPVATVEAWGLTDGQPTGRHFWLRVYDDVVEEGSVGTPEQIEKTTKYWELSLNLGPTGVKGPERYYGTRYHFADTYRQIMDRGAAIPRIRSATDDGTLTGNPVLLSTEVFEDKVKRMGSYTVSCQLLLNPLADKAQGFRSEWLQYYDKNPHPGNRYLICDPAGEKKKSNDYTVQLVIELGQDQNYYLLDGVRSRMNLTERTDSFFRLHRKWKPLKVGYEKYGKDSDIEHIRHVQNTEGYRFGIIELGGSVPKNDRIKKLVPVFENSRFYLPHRLLFVDNEGRQKDLVRAFVDEEYLEFPVATHDDLLDCAARILDEKLGAVFPIEITKGNNGKGQTHTDNSSPHYGWKKTGQERTERDTFQSVMWRK